MKTKCENVPWLPQNVLTLLYWCAYAHTKHYTRMWGQVLMLGALLVKDACLVGQLSRNKLAVEACDVGDRLVFGAFGLASASVGAVSKAQFFHRHHHSLGAFCCFGLALGQQSQLANLRADEEHLDSSSIFFTLLNRQFYE